MPPAATEPESRADSARFGFAPFELWVESLDANAVADLEPHDRDRVALVLTGHGDLRIDGAAQRFHAPCSLIMQRDTQCEIVNIGTEPLRLIFGVAGASSTTSIGPLTAT